MAALDKLDKGSKGRSFDFTFFKSANDLQMEDLKEYPYRDGRDIY
jgi:hypothetical protein